MPIRLLRVMLALVVLGGCRRAPSSSRPLPEAPAHRDAEVAAGRGPSGPTDATFVVTSDTHLGYDGIEPVNERIIAQTNAIAGRSYPSPLTGIVGRPRGLVVTGDLTEWGRSEEWERFVALYGLTGKETKLTVPVFEMIGNHDKVHGPWVESHVVARHGGRAYAWTWDGLRLIALGEAPDEQGLAFLQQELARLDPSVPVLLFFHLALEGPWSTGNWFGDGDGKARLAKVVEGKRVIGIFHGHHHARGHYQWQGIDVIKPGAAKNDAHTFAVVHVTGDTLRVGWFDFDAARWVDAFEKRFR